MRNLCASFIRMACATGPAWAGLGGQLRRRGFKNEKLLRIILPNGLRRWPSVGWVGRQLRRRGFQNEKPLRIILPNGLHRWPSVGCFFGPLLRRGSLEWQTCTPFFRMACAPVLENHIRISMSGCCAA